MVTPTVPTGSQPGQEVQWLHFLTSLMWNTSGGIGRQGGTSMCLLVGCCFFFVDLFEQQKTFKKKNAKKLRQIFCKIFMGY